MVGTGYLVPTYLSEMLGLEATLEDCSVAGLGELKHVLQPKNTTGSHQAMNCTIFRHSRLNLLLFQFICYATGQGRSVLHSSTWFFNGF